MTITAVNNAPTIVAGNTLSYTENQAATALSPALTVTDPDNTNLTGASAQITGNYVTGQDVLAFATLGSITGSFNVATGMMTLSGTDTVANYQAALRSITYVNTSETPAGASRTVTWLATDGAASQLPGDLLDHGHSGERCAGGHSRRDAEVHREQVATVIDTTVAVSDVDSVNLVGASVQITGGYTNGQDVLSFTNTATITATFVPTRHPQPQRHGHGGELPGRPAGREVLNTSENPSTAVRTVAWTVTDGSATSNAPTSTINITAVNDAPVVTAGNTLTYTESQGATAVSPALTVTDADSTNLTGATVQITGGYLSSEDVLSMATAGAISATFNSGTGTLTLTGSDTVANYQAALRTVKYDNISESPSTISRTVTWIATDGTDSSSPVTSSITVVSVNDAPVVTAGGSLTYTENDPASVIDNTITVSDVDSANMTGATVTISGNFASGQDVLSMATLGPISAAYNAGTGTLTLTGTDTAANYQAALRTVKYTNSSENPSSLSRTITWVVNDGAGSNNLSAGVTSTITVVAVNDAPVLANAGVATFTEDGGPIVVAGM